MSWDRVERLLGASVLDALRQRQVAVVGLGSGGGFVAVSLAMSGVSRFVLIDDDVLEAANVVRHVADHRDVGRPKVEAVADLIRQRNADAEIATFNGRMEDHEDALAGIDVLVCAVDGEGTKFYINEWCLRHGITAVYAGVYERGEGGDVVVIDAEDGPCYACWAATLREGVMTPSPDGGGDLDYGMLNERGTLDAEPGLWLHVTRVAATQADIVLNLLLQETPVHREMPANTVVLANHALEILEGTLTPPYSAEWVAIPRGPACLICGDQGSLADARTHDLSLASLAGELLDEDEDHEREYRSEE